jgi:hypothetical protein
MIKMRNFDFENGSTATRAKLSGIASQFTPPYLKKFLV